MLSSSQPPSLFSGCCTSNWTYWKSIQYWCFSFSDKKFHLFGVDTQPMKKSLSCRKKSLGGHNKLARDCSVQIFSLSTYVSLKSLVAPNPHKMVQYLEPLQLVRGLSFSVEYVGLGIYDHGYLTSPFYCKCPRDKSLLDYLLGYVQSLQKDFGYRLEGIIVANSSSVVPRKIIHNLMDNLYKKGKFETFYTCWEHDLTYYGTQTIYSAQYMLQAFLHHCNTLLLCEKEAREDSMREEAFLHHCNTLLLSDKEEREDSEREEKRCKICHSGAEHKMVRYLEPLELFQECMVQYMEPLPLFRECMKRNYHMPSSVFLGLSFSDDYVSLAMSDDCYSTARFYNGYTRNDSLLDKLVDVVQMLNKDFEYDLEGIIVAYSSSTAPPEKICNLMESLCKKGKFASLKYTFWEDDLASEGVEFECNKFGSSFWGKAFPVDLVIQQAYDKTFSAQDMLRAFLHSFNNLHKDKDRVEWEDFERKKQCKICHSRAEHKYLEPLQLFRESMKRTFYMPPAVFLGLSISDKNVSLAVSDRRYSDACSYGIYH